MRITFALIRSQDIVSYNKEQAYGDDRSNILTIAMHQFGIDLHGAFDWVAKRHEELETEFLNLMRSVPSWGPEADAEIFQYIEHIGNWPRGNDCWSFECERYFGDKGKEIQATRRVLLLPKVYSDVSSSGSE